jgi:UDP-N-acetylglucosamine--N-acetylmuramyl-(pentapeptide) pyrophosphoryl-undecaprenol N-acetylglucosamine transferase
MLIETHGTSQREQMKKVLIVAGGTGGHVFPGIAVARVLRENHIKVSWLGTVHGLDATLVPQEGIDYYQIPMVGLRGKSLIRKLKIPFLLLKTIVQSIRLIKKIKPDVVLGMGGYVTAPAGIAARLTHTKLVIHEQNAIAGMANRYLAKIAKIVLQAFPNSFQHTVLAITVGNPVRKPIAALPDPVNRLAEHHDKLRVLVVGGSLGAQALNRAMPAVLQQLQTKITVYHQTGKATYVETLQAYQQHNLIAQVVEFIDDMAAAYQWADVVLCRAGALTVSELAAAGLASVLVPLPIAVDDHQTANARYLTDNQAGILLPQKHLTAKKLIEIFDDFYQYRDKVLTMSNNARQCAVPDAVQRVIEFVVQ